MLCNIIYSEPVKQLSSRHQLQHQSDVSVRLKDLLQLDLNTEEQDMLSNFVFTDIFTFTLFQTITETEHLTHKTDVILLVVERLPSDGEPALIENQL